MGLSRGRPKGSKHIIEGQYKRDGFTPDEITNMLMDAKRAKGYAHPVPNSYLAQRDACLIAILALFGKRESEVASIRRKGVTIDGDRMLIRFRLSKRLTKKKLAKDPNAQVPTVVKPKTLRNPLVKYITDYIVIRDSSYPRSPWLFPSGKIKGAHIRPWHVWRIIKRLNKNAWPHWFRHSLADMMVKHRREIQELMEWFDWKRADTAVDYVRAGAGGRIREMGEEDYWVKSV